MGKIIGALLVVLLFFALFFPRWLPRLFRSIGRAVRGAGQVGRELATGEEEPESPLARYEVQAGRLVLFRLETTLLESRDAETLARVRDIGRRLVEHASRREIPYEFRLIEDDEPNAFAVPGGTIFVTRALVDLCDEEPDGLAGVVGHEVAHIELRHALYHLATRAAVRAGTGIILLGRRILVRRMAKGIEELLVQGYRQDQELAADRTGADLARRAGYDPRGLARVLERLERLAGASDESALDEALGYFRSHPPLAERRALLERRYGAPTAR